MTPFERFLNGKQDSEKDPGRRNGNYCFVIFSTRAGVCFKPENPHRERHPFFVGLQKLYQPKTGMQDVYYRDAHIEMGEDALKESEEEDCNDSSEDESDTKFLEDAVMAQLNLDS